MRAIWEVFMMGMRRPLLAWAVLAVPLTACSTGNEKPYVPEGPVIATSSARSKLAPSGVTLGGVEAGTNVDCTQTDDPDCVPADSGV
jgi:hypothetical protein